MRQYTPERCPVCHRAAPTTDGVTFDAHPSGSQQCKGTGQPTQMGKLLQNLLVAGIQMLVLVDGTTGVLFGESLPLPTTATAEDLADVMVAEWRHLPFIEDVRRAVFEVHKQHPGLLPSGLVWAPAQEGAPVLAMGPTPEAAPYDVKDEVYCSDFCDAAQRCIMSGGCGRTVKP